MALDVAFGSFAKSTGGAPASQSISSLSFTPKAILFWSAGGLVAGTIRNDFYGMIGATAGVSASRAVGCAADEGLGFPPNSSSRSASKAITIVEWGESLLAECDLTSFNADGFTLNWTTNNGVAYIIHYLALGGSDLTDADVVDWLVNTSTGNQSVSSLSFQPDLCIHFTTSRFATTVPSNGSHAGLGLGCMNATDEWSMQGFTQDADILFRANSGCHDDRCISGVNTSNAVDMACSRVSLDSNGFMVNVDTAPPTGYRVMSLCLKGLLSDIGNFAKTTSAAPVTQDVTGISFEPSAYLLASSHNTSFAIPEPDNLFSLGGTDGTAEEGSHLGDDHTANPTVSFGLEKTDRILIGDTDLDGSIDFECEHSSFASGKFTLNWPTNDAVAEQCMYLAFGSAAVPPGTDEIAAAVQPLFQPARPPNPTPIPY